MSTRPKEDLGCVHLCDGRYEFLVWAPRVEKVQVHIVWPAERFIEMRPEARGYHRAVVGGLNPGDRYFYRFDGQTDRPDPASRLQPDVHGPSEIPDLRFEWHDSSWRGLPLAKYVLYELHVGTFTPQGTLDAIIPRLADLKDLGVTSIELMPLAQFPGARNWGYDGVYLYAVHTAYGGPLALKRFVDACHQHELAVTLDVVYNHLGPEGNYLSSFGPYFTDHYKTPWGDALNFDLPQSDEVRRYFIDNALYWVTEFHIDALRLDAVHAIIDSSALPFVEQLALAVHERAKELDRAVHVIAESDRNDSRITRGLEKGGWGFDATWDDDIHHAVHVLLTGEQTGYYADFGGIGCLAAGLREGFIYSGQYSSYRQRSHGNSGRDLPGECFVVFSQNHDQVGNRMLGERLSSRVGFESLKLAAGAILLSPFVPLIFMGEEYSEKAPFLYFVSHSDPALIEAVRKGRADEFRAFRWEGEPIDPQSEDTFARCKLHWDERNQAEHGVLRAFYKELLRLRREIPAFASLDMQALRAILQENCDVLVVRRPHERGEAVIAFHFGAEPARASLSLVPGSWAKIVDSAESRWSGPGSSAPSAIDSKGETSVALSPKSFVVYAKS
ncbi:MAG TPA: malto-oligosyltrehalose trehalohydrolase [Candidatus Acidoferrales bacterium]|nr:malto-oligosyltrehalose trehalohydrolase [Candidatus Acidoferrales bacterium]